MAIRALVDTLGHGPIYTQNATPYSPARARTLQERLSTYQNCSTSVRSTGRLPEEPHPVHRPRAGDEGHLDGDYFDELRSPEIHELRIYNERLRMGHEQRCRQAAHYQTNCCTYFRRR